MDPVRNPVLQRLNIPAQLNHNHQELQLQDNSHFPDVTVKAGKPFVINLPSQTSIVEVITLSDFLYILLETSIKDRVVV